MFARVIDAIPCGTKWRLSRVLLSLIGWSHIGRARRPSILDATYTHQNVVFVQRRSESKTFLLRRRGIIHLGCCSRSELAEQPPIRHDRPRPKGSVTAVRRVMSPQ